MRSAQRSITSRLTACLSAGLGLAACGPSDVPEELHTRVLRVLEFAREGPPGVSKGMDLDGRVSRANDTVSCGKEDFVAPDGTPGIDNELGRLLPLIDLAGENAVQELVQGTINEGRMMVLFEIVERGEALELLMKRGMDRPLLGTDNRILPGQTLALHPDPLLGRAKLNRREDGTLQTEPFELQLPILVFSVLYEVRMPAAIVRLYPAVDGGAAEGLIAGGVPIDQLMTILRQATEVGGDFEGLFGDALRDSADLDRGPDGVCRATSVAVTFETVPAFTFAD